MMCSDASKEVRKGGDEGRSSRTIPRQVREARPPFGQHKHPRARAHHGRQTTAAVMKLGQECARGGIEGWRRPE